MIPRILHQTAETASLTWEEKVLVARARGVLRGWSYKLWTNADRSALIQRQFPQHAEQYALIKRGIVRSDISRYAFLYECGGLYIDTDYKLTRPFDRFQNETCILPVEVEGDAPEGARPFPDRSGDFKLGNALLASAPKHPFWADLIDQIFADGGDALNDGNPVLQTGPVALTKCWQRKHDAYPDILTPPSSVFLPAMTRQNFSYSKTPETCGVHLCWGAWRGKHGIQKVRNVVRRKATSVLP